MDQRNVGKMSAPSNQEEKNYSVMLQRSKFQYSFIIKDRFSYHWSPLLFKNFGS